jgi:hypothetical protein
MTEFNKINNKNYKYKTIQEQMFHKESTNFQMLEDMKKL